MPARSPAMLIAALMILPPAAADAASSAVEGRLRAVRLSIAGSCGLQGWQFALEPDARGQTRVELSPTLPNKAVVCVYQALADYDVELDRPAPVQVTANRVARPDTIY